MLKTWMDLSIRRCLKIGVFLCVVCCAVFPTDGWTYCYNSELRLGYFYPTSSTVRDIYKSGGIEFEYQGAAYLTDRVDVWANFGYFERKSYSIAYEFQTTLQVYPLSVGLQYHIPLLECLDLCLGFGASSTWINIHDDSPFIQQHIHKQAWGGVGKCCLIYYFCNRFFIDLYADYYYTKIPSSNDRELDTFSVDISGIRAGVGLGMEF